MSGTYNTANTANTADNTDHPMFMFTGQKSEFGMSVFSNPRAQETYKYQEDEYKKKYALKQAYDKQEFLRRMRVDIRREYLTRKKQVKCLQQDAAVDFRNAEMSLQEHYSTQGQQQSWKIRAVDICAPLVSEITLPNGDLLDLKTFQADSEFVKVVDFHKSLIHRQNESERQWREQEAANQAAWGQGIVALGEWYDQSPPTSADEEEEEDDGSAINKRGAFGGCYDDNQDDAETETNALNSNNKWGLPMSAEEREILEKGEAAQNQRSEDPSCYYTFINTHDAIDHATWVLASIQERQATAGMTEEEREAHYREIQRRAYSDDEEEEEQRWIENTDGLWDEEAIADEADYRRELAQMKTNGDGDDYADVKQLEVVKVPEPKERVTASAAGGMISAQKKAVAGAAAKARIAKQQRKKQQKQTKQFVPLQVTANTNHTNEVTVTLSTNKLEINLPKKHLQNATREAMKLHNRKWNRINAAQKRMTPRGTTVANIPQPNFDGHSDSDGGY